MREFLRDSQGVAPLALGFSITGRSRGINFAAALLILALTLTLSKDASAHGAGWRTPPNKPVAAEFYYSTGDAMAGLEAEVYSPEDENVSFQSGRTDEHGRFAFTPDSAGAWRVTVKDSIGHMAEAVLELPENFFEAGSSAQVHVHEEHPAGGLNVYVKAALWVSLLFNAAAFAFLRKNAKKVL